MDNELYHYGVKGMKWGQRKFIPRIGRRRRAAAQPIVSTRKRLSGRDSTQIAQRRKAARRASNLKKVAKGAAIVGGTALAAYGAYKMHGILKDPGNRRLIKAGVKMYADMAKGHAENVYNKASNFYRNARHIVNTPKRVIQSTGIGKAAVTGFAGATFLSDANSIQQWVRRTHKNGKITGKDIKDLGIDILNPIPNNIPRFDKMIKNKLSHGELYHHGVKGMKWGIRKAIRSFGKNRSARIKKRNDRYREKMYRKTKDTYYKRASDRAIRVERARKITRNVAIGAAVIAGAYFAYRHFDKYKTLHMDDVLLKGTKIQSVGMHDKLSAGKKFYGAHVKADQFKYINNFGVDPFGNTKTIYAGKLNRNVKVLGIDKGQKLFDDMIKKNPNMKKYWKNYNNFNSNALLGSRGYSGEGYQLMPQGPGAKFVEKFKSMAIKKGYSAVADINDRINSGFNTKAVIFLDSKKPLFDSVSVKRITQDIINNSTSQQIKAETIKYYTNKTMKTILPMSILAAGGLSLPVKKARQEDKKRK